MITQTVKCSCGHYVKLEYPLATGEPTHEMILKREWNYSFVNCPLCNPNGWNEPFPNIIN